MTNLWDLLSQKKLIPKKFQPKLPTFSTGNCFVNHYQCLKK